MVCLGDLVMLKAVVTEDEPPFTFEWYDNENLAGTPLGTGPTIEVIPDRTTTYWVKASNEDDSGVASATVKVKPGPAIKLVNLRCMPNTTPRTYALTFRAIADTISFSPDTFTLEQLGEFDYRLSGIPSGDTISIKAEIDGSDCIYEVQYTNECDECQVDVTQPTICQGDSTTISVTSNGEVLPFNFEWFDNPALTGSPISVGPQLTVDPAATSTYYVKTSVFCGEKIDSATVVVEPKPTLEILNTVCVGSIETYGITFTSNGDDFITIPEELEIVEEGNDRYTIFDVPLGTSVIIQSAFENSDCFAEAEANLEDCCQTDPGVEITTMDTTVCPGSHVLLQAKGSGDFSPYSFEWFDNVTLENVIGDQAEVIVTPTATTTFFVRMSTPCGEAIDSVMVTTLEAPALFLRDTICADDNTDYCVTLETDGTPNIPDLYPVTQNGNSYEICNLPSRETVKITVTGANGCEESIDLNVNCEECIKSLSVNITTSSETDSLCAGDCVTLTANINGNQPPFSFKWSANSDFSGDIISEMQSVEVCPAESTWYYLMVDDTESDTPECTDVDPTPTVMDSVFITVIPKPTITLVSTECEAGDQTFCAIVAIDPALTPTVPVAGATVQTVAGVPGQFEICGLPAGQTTVISVTAENGCDASVEVNQECPKPCDKTLEVNITTASETDTRCAGDCVTLTANVNGNQPPFSFQWFDNSSLSGSPFGNDATIEVCPNEDSWYYLVVDDTESSAPECVGIPPTPTIVDSVFISVNSAPTLTLVATLCESDSTFCALVSTDMEATIRTTPSFDPLRVSDTPITFEICGIPTNSSVMVEAESSEGCSSSLTIDPFCPEELVVIVTDSDIPDCTSNVPVEVLLMAINTGSGQPLDIQWYDNPALDTPIGSGDTLTVIADTTTTYFAIATDNECCVDTASFIVPVNIIPELTLDPLECSANRESYTVTGMTTASVLTVNVGTLSLEPDGNFSIVDIPSDTDLSVEAIDILSGCTNQAMVIPAEECCFPVEAMIEATADPNCILLGDEAQLTVNPPCQGCTYSWTPSTDLSDPSIGNPIATPSATTIYEVNVSDENECLLGSDTTQVIVLECGPDNIFLPNVFTPNGDNVNDILQLQVINVERVKLVMYSRFGVEVVDFEWELPSGASPLGPNGQKPWILDVWDGRHQGKMQNPSVYGFYLEATCLNADEPEIRQGDITLLR